MAFFVWPAMTVEQIDIELAEIAEKINPLFARAEHLNREKRRLTAQAFITANGVTRDNVEMSSGGDKPWFGILSQFANWLRKTNCQKRFCEWNGTIYFTAEIIAGRMDPNAPASVDDLPEAA